MATKKQRTAAAPVAAAAPAETPTNGDVEDAASTTGTTATASSDSRNAFLKVFWDLAELNPSTRVAAVESIVQHLTQANDAEELAYTLKRLVRGLASSRDAARQGFSTALTALLHHFPSAVSVESVLDLLKSTMDVSASMKGMEQRDHMFGRLFGLLAIHASGRLAADSADADHLDTLLDQVIALSKWKKWFREVCYEGLLTIVESLAPATFLSTALPKLAALLAGPVAQFNADQVGLAVGLHQYVHTHGVATDASVVAVPAITSIVNRHHFQHLVDPLKSSTSIYPRLHSSWRRLVAHFTAASKLDEERFQEMWAVLVEGMLVAQGSSHERRGTALKLFEALLPSLPGPTLRAILTPHFVKCIHNNAVSKKTYLHEAAVHVLQTFVSSQPIEFFHFLQHHFLHPLTCLVSHLPDDDDDDESADAKKKGGFEALLALEEDKERAEFQAKRITSARMWALDTMYTAALKLPATTTTDAVWNAALGFFLTHAFFEPAAAPKKGKKKATAEPSPALGPTVVNALGKRVYALLGLGNQVLKDASVALDTSVPFRMWQLWGDLTTEGRLTLKSPLSTEHAAQRTAVGKQLKTLVGQVAAATDKKDALRLKGFTLLNVCVGLQLLDPAQRNEASSVLVDLARCLTELHAPAKKAAGKKKAAAAADDQQPLAVLIDMLLSMLAQESSVMRDIVNHVFRSIMEQLDAASVQSMVEVVVSSADDEKAMLDMDEEDDDEDGAPIDPTKLTAASNDDDDDEDHDMDNDDDDSAEPEEDEETIALADLQREDAALSAMVGQVAEKKKAKQHAKRLRMAALHFKVRVLDLLQVYAGSAGAVHVVAAIEPLFKAWTALKPHSDTLVWSERVGAVLQKIARRTKETAVPATDAIVAALQAVLTIASATICDKKQAAVAAALVAYLVRTALKDAKSHADLDAAAVAAVHAALVPSISTLLTKKHAKLPRVVLDHFVQTAPVLAGAFLFDTLSSLVLDDSKAADDFARAEVIRYLTALLKTKNAVPVPVLAASGPALHKALVDSLTKVKGKRLKGVANCAQALLKARVDAKDDSIDAIGLGGELKALLQVEEGAAAPSPVVKGMVAQMLQVLAGPTKGDKKKADKKRKRPSDAANGNATSQE